VEALGVFTLRNTYYVDYGRNFDFSHRYVPTTALELAQLGGKLLRMVDNQLSTSGFSTQLYSLFS
jgi:hypothetical protein